MTISNYLTLFRILMVPVFVAILLDSRFADGTGRLLAVIILVIASLTDALDGYLARVRNEVTRLGRLLDPIADKLLISAAMIAIVQIGLAPAWMVVIILGREFAVSGLRLIAATEGFDIKVSGYGKFKMIAQVVAVGLLIYSPRTLPAGIFMLWVVMGLSLWSMGLYFHNFLQGMDPARRAQLSHRRSLAEIKEEVISTTRSLRDYRRKRKAARRRRRLMRKQGKSAVRPLAAAREKQRTLQNAYRLHPLMKTRSPRRPNSSPQDN